MKTFKNINIKQKKYLYIIPGVMVIIAVIVLLLLFQMFKGGNSTETGAEYVYGTYVESKLADDVICYLSDAGADVFDQNTREELAECSVQSYNAVIDSGTAAVTDEHSKALIKIFMNKLLEYKPGLAEEELYTLSCGISSYVWQAVLLSIDNYKASDMPADYNADYIALAESLQAQINALEEKRMNIHITAKIKDNEPDSEDGKDGKDGREEITKYLSGVVESVNSNMEEKISHMDDDIDKKVDSIKDEISEKVAKELKESIKDGKDGKEGKDGREGAAGKDGKNGENGKDGKDGVNGKDGKNGENGKDGKDGANGKSTYIAYADDASGSGFSLTPTETSKYIGLCITSADRQPLDVSQYNNWQLYRSYIITSATDENNNTTLYIK